jgi:CHAT domain-containing protein/tetratricopeptide (TPR) repeat protein
MRRVLLWVAGATLASLLFPALGLHGQTAAGEAAVQQVVERFFAAYAQKDLDAFMVLWSAQAPDYAGRKKTMQEIFAETGPIEVKSLALVRTKVEEAKAWARVKVELVGNDVKTGKPYPLFGKLDRSLHLVREGETWKVWKYLTYYDDRIAALLAAPSKAERAEILAEDRQLPRDLVLLLNSEAFALGRAGKFAEALRRSDLAVEIAQSLTDKEETAWCACYRGVVFEQAKKYPEALQEYDRALAVFRQLAQRPAGPVTLQGRGGAYMDLGEAADQGQAVVLNHQGRVYVHLGRAKEAVAAFEASGKLFQALAFLLSVDERISGLPKYYLNLLDQQARLEEAFLQLVAQNKPAEALAQLEKLLAVERIVFGDVHDHVANGYDWQARLHTELENFEAARQAAEKGLAMRVQLHGDHHWRVANVRLDLDWVGRLESVSPEQRQRFWAAKRAQRQTRPLYTQGKYAEVVPLLRSAIDAYEKLFGADSHHYAFVLDDLADVCRKLGDDGQAEALWRKVCAIRQKVLGPQHPASTRSLGDLGAMLVRRAWQRMRRGDYPAARDNLREVVGINEQLRGEKAILAFFRWYLACLERLVALTPEQRHRFHEAFALLVWGEWREALARGEQALETVRTLLGEENFAYATGLVRLADGCEQHWQFARAEQLLQRLLQILEKVGVTEASPYARQLGRLGKIAVQRGDDAQAEVYLRQAVAKLKATLGEDHPDTILAIGWLAKCYADLGDDERAFPLYCQVVQFHKRRMLGQEARGYSFRRFPFLNSDTTELKPAHLEYAQASMGLATLYAHKGNYGVAEPLFRQCAQIVKKMYGENHPDYADALRNLGRLHYWRGDYERATQDLRQALTIRERLRGKAPLRDTETLGLLALVYVRQGNFAAAEELYRQATAIDKEVLGQDHWRYRLHLLSLATTLQYLNRGAEAFALMQQAMELDQRSLRRAFAFSSEAGMHNYLARLGPRLEILVHMAAAEDAPDAATTAILWDWVLRRKGAILEALCRFREARQLLRGDAALTEQAGRLNALRQRLSDLPLNPPPATTAAGLQLQLRALGDEADRLEAGLNRALAEHRPEQLGAADTVSLDKLRQQLPKGAALVEFLRVRTFRSRPRRPEEPPAPDRYFAFVLSADPGAPPRLINLGDADAIDAAVSEVCGKLERFPRETGSEKAKEATFRTVSANLYQLVVAPLRAALGGATTVFVAADGELNRVPFPALVDKQGRYLVEHYRFAYLTSGRDLLRPPAPPGRGTAIFADPDYDLKASQRQQEVQTVLGPKGPAPAGALVLRGGLAPGVRGRTRWDRLAGALAEAADIEKELAEGPYGPVKTYEGSRALEEVFKAVRSPRILHVATHGFFLPRPKAAPGPHGPLPASGEGRLEPMDNPLLRSGLVLAGANRLAEEAAAAGAVDDGWVTAEEIALMDLRGTELVVLSACESGLGDIQAGEGVYGLRRALLYAGARTLVTGLFKVPDAETRELMKLFYQGLKAGQGKLGALHEAQRGLLEQRRKQGGAAHPFYWAGFVLVGDPT